MSLSPGSTIGQDTIVSAIGAGGMGEVYRATEDHRLRIPSSGFSRRAMWPSRSSDVTADGRVLAAIPVPSRIPPSITVVTNWPRLLEKHSTHTARALEPPPSDTRAASSKTRFRSRI